MAKASKKRVISHAVGGPSASRGPTYQVYFAIYETLELIMRHYSAPGKPLSISIEPRVVEREAKSVTTWDVLVEADSTAWEAKLNATRQDLVEWMHRIQTAGETQGGARFGS